MLKRYYVFTGIAFVLIGMVSCNNPAVSTPDFETLITNPDNDTPYPILGPGSLNVSKPPGDSTIDLIVDTQGGLNDPDGDEVTFHYSIAYQDMGTAADIIVDISNVSGVGLLTVTHPGSVLYDEYVLLNLWTMDTSGQVSTVFTPFALFYEGD